MPSHIDRQFNRVYISVKDMDQSVEFATAAERVSDPIVQRALLTATIVSYARPFSANRTHPSAVVQPPSVLGNLTEEERTLHERLCEIRNKAIAHSDFEMNPSRPVEYRDTGFLVASRLYDPLSESLNIPAIRALAEKLKKSFADKLFELSRIAAASDDSGP